MKKKRRAASVGMTAASDIAVLCETN